MLVTLDASSAALVEAMYSSSTVDYNKKKDSNSKDSNENASSSTAELCGSLLLPEAALGAAQLGSAAADAATLLLRRASASPAQLEARVQRGAVGETRSAAWASALLAALPAAAPIVVLGRVPRADVHAHAHAHAHAPPASAASVLRVAGSAAWWSSSLAAHAPLADALAAAQPLSLPVGGCAAALLSAAALRQRPALALLVEASGAGECEHALTLAAAVLRALDTHAPAAATATASDAAAARTAALVDDAVPPIGIYA